MRQKQRIRRQSAVCLPLRDSQRLVVVRIVLLINTYLVYAPLGRDTCGYTLEPNNVLYLSDYQIIHSIFFVV